MDQANLGAGKSGREFIIWKAYQVFREQGYYHTSMADIGQSCQMQKGSLYHHFSSKEDLMQHVLEAAYRLFKEEVFEIALQAQVDAKQRLEQMLTTLDHFYFDRQGGCLMGLMGLEVANRIPEFSQTIKQFFLDWIEAFTQLFKTRYPQQEAREVAQRAVGEIEGAVMLACIFLDKQYFDATLVRIRKLLA